MSVVTRFRPFARFLATVVLAYGLALSGLMGSIASGAHAGEARIAAQLGLICTVHGTFDPRSEQSDPTPGKISCFDHCTLSASTLAAVPLPASVLLAALDPAVAVVDASDDGLNLPVMSLGIPPPPRGPPAIL